MYTLREWQKLPKNKNDLIVNASTKGGLDLEEKFPIGVSIKHSRAFPLGNHENLALCSLLITDEKNNRKTSRKQVVELMENIGIPNQTLPPSIYYQELPKYKFMISPAGNGTDCHRHYEALMAGCIPIVEHHPLIYRNYGNCPILYTRDYTEITLEYLEQKYTEMIDRKFDFSKLFFSSYSPELQETIRQNSLYWKTAIINPLATYKPKWMLK